MNSQCIILKNVSVHNLKDVSLCLKIGEFIVFTGVSGSGKSSLAFHTIFAEGQRRYGESLSVFLQQYFKNIKKPDADNILGLSPTIAVEQSSSFKNPRSTVGTVTEIYDYLRLLFAKIAIPIDPITKNPIKKENKESLLNKILLFFDQKKIIIFSPLLLVKTISIKKILQNLLKKGFYKIRINGLIQDTEDALDAEYDSLTSIDVLIDRLKIIKNNPTRFTESFFSALKIGEDQIIIYDTDTEINHRFSLFTQNANAVPVFTPQDFSFNHPVGMCMTCRGLGYEPFLSTLKQEDLSKKNSHFPKFHRITNIEEKLDTSLIHRKICSSCLGSKLKPLPSEALLAGHTIHDICKRTISNTYHLFLEIQHTTKIKKGLEEVFDAILQRLNFLDYLGLGYLSLNRPMPSLSGGEAQRVKLAAHLGSKLTGVTYILDEPSIGLHPRDNQKLLYALKLLQSHGNTIIVVEHDEETIAAADTIVDFGPGAGTLGGHILYNGPLNTFIKSSNTITANYLRREISFSKNRPHKVSNGKGIHLKGVSHHNLKNISLFFPEGLFIVVTGVSGSGKSSLINEVLYPLLSNKLSRTDYPAGKCQKLLISSSIKKVIAIDQTSIGKTPRSNPATYIGVFDHIRQLFGQLPQSISAGFSSSRFSFNVRDGSCHECLGMGMIRINMDFLEDSWLTCSACNGKRFDSKTLAVFYKRKNIHDVLEMTVSEALEFFKTNSLIHKKLEALSKIGLDYLKLGQSATTLSGGEAQRIKLAKELLKPSKGDTFYILDEPTTGLHMHDVNALLKVLLDLSNRGNTITVIEHNPEVMRTADLIIDLGPEGADEGGYISGYGTPEEIALIDSPTGHVLKKCFKKSSFLLQKNTEQYKALDHTITLKDLSQNNLKNITVSLPREAITVCTGPSGAGKSSFAFDSLFAEGQRRYATSFSTYLRNLLHKPEKPLLKEALGLSPTIAVEQQATSVQTSSTVGTLSEIYDYLRILYVHLGIAYSPINGEKIIYISPESLSLKIIEKNQSDTLLILAPVFPNNYESFNDFILSIQKLGFLRIKIDEELLEIDEISSKYKKSLNFSLLIDKLTVSQKFQGRIREAISQSFFIANNSVLIQTNNTKSLFTQGFCTEISGVESPPITSSIFSFNMVDGMCPCCRGKGKLHRPTLNVNDPDISSSSIKSLLTSIFTEKKDLQACKILMATLNIKETQSINSLSKKVLNPFLKGISSSNKEKKALSPIPGIEDLYIAYSQDHLQHHPGIIYEETICHECLGSRIIPLARNVFLDGLSLPDLCNMPMHQALSFLKKIAKKEDKPKTVQEVINRIIEKMTLLIDIGLEHLNLGRSSSTLSNGERQRIQLAKQLGTHLRGIIYIIEEPSSGLHPADISKLISTFKKLKKLGNTIVLIDHDPMILKHADKILDFGPGSGKKEGGFLIAEGSIKEIKQNPKSLTGLYLSEKKTLQKKPFREINLKNSFSIKKINQGFLKNFNISIPFEATTCIMGISGSGKSTLMTKVIKPFIEKEIIKKRSVFTHVLYVNPHLIHKNGRSDVGSYSTLTTYLRNFYECLPEAKTKGLTSSFFSRNHKGGMCSACEGRGFILNEMTFLPDFKSECQECNGQRLNPLSLSVLYKGKSFGDIIKMTIYEIVQLFSFISEVTSIGEILLSLNLHYLPLEQAIDTLSCGEAHRLKLAKELIKRKGKKILYLLDEPTMGLHPEDINKLLNVFNTIIAEGHTIVYIEHHVDLMKFADHIIELGPEAGENGGYLLFTGSPEKIKGSSDSLSRAFF
ncbi:UvrABC system protein A [Candidatus Clavichlamydia salmonicola]|uniref:excinuclease ABC subunit UvrA n=1 Tax=Candidatus Clavichlamydia salmonicola TaxID=469812 RepID=UPI001891BE97|nr:excinuclease ABC subunit UvrA [Candidatus Clavichlamydia salmonicola]MBF5051225.1 UvrABC system protein A [Candidatus Clavichlamydia salmonicola]